MLISRGCLWVSMERGGCKFGGSKTGAVHGQKGGGAVVSQLVLKLKESVPPPPGSVPQHPRIQMEEQRTLKAESYLVKPMNKKIQLCMHFQISFSVLNCDPVGLPHAIISYRL